MANQQSFRAGRYAPQIGGYQAFIPESLPPTPALVMDAELTRLLSDADRSLGRLDGVASVLPNPNLFVAMYVQQEAVLSSQIEGTQSTLEDVLQYEIDAQGYTGPRDVEEVVNYVYAMNHGLQRLQTLPLSLRLIREVHARLLVGTRGADKSPGEFRREQNWIGPARCSLHEATFVPPPVDAMHDALDNLETMLHDTTLPVLVQCGLLHAQFETIHPFIDGNGRVGRLLITFLLCQRDVLRLPLLYLSYYLKLHRAEYYDRLMAIRNSGDWEGWMRFFLRGVDLVSQEATKTARAILQLREQHRQLIAQSLNNNAYGTRMLDLLFEHPLISAQFVVQQLSCTSRTAGKLIDEFEELQLLQETTGYQRNRRYRYTPYLALFAPSLQRPDAGTDAPPPAQTLSSK